MTADKGEADEVAAALRLAEGDRWVPPAPAPVQQMPHALIPDYSGIRLPSFLDPPASQVAYVSPQSTPRPKRRARMRGRKGKR
jgi:hypothetical protein